jgi:preprotein translocase subunit SecF
MKRVIQFSRARYFFFAFSILLVLIGVVGYIVNHGFNLGVDFKAGIALQFQVAPASFTVQYNGPDKAEISIPAGEEALTSAGDIIITITSAKDGSKKAFPFRYSSFASVRDLTAAVSKVPGLTVEQVGNMDAVPTELLPLTRPQDIAGKPAYINLSPGPGRGVQTDLPDMRATLAPMGQAELQVVGAPVNQEFITRLEAKTEDPTFQTTTENNLRKVLELKYGVGQVILKSTNFIGRRVAQSLGTQAIWLVLIAVALILVYMMFRFHPPIYAVSAIIGIMHDALVMLSFDAVFRVEIDAATIAAVLTILGYSINDTIVIFDRVRENKNLMRGTPLRSILDTSVTQTLSRTFITSGATLLTVIALFLLTSGSLKNFSLNMIVGIVEGTYSTFISSFIVLEWTKMMDRRHKKREMDKYGIGSAVEPLQQKTAEMDAVEVEAEVEGDDEGEPEGLVPEPVGLSGTVPGAPSPDAGQPMPVPAGQQVPAAQPAAAQPVAAQQAQRAPGNVMAFPGQSGSRKNKKRRRRHH